MNQGLDKAPLWVQTPGQNKHHAKVMTTWTKDWTKPKSMCYHSSQIPCGWTTGWHGHQWRWRWGLPPSLPRTPAPSLSTGSATLGPGACRESLWGGSQTKPCSRQTMQDKPCLRQTKQDKPCLSTCGSLYVRHKKSIPYIQKFALWLHTLSTHNTKIKWLRKQ